MISFSSFYIQFFNFKSFQWHIISPQRLVSGCDFISCGLDSVDSGKGSYEREPKARCRDMPLSRHGSRLPSLNW